MMSMCKVISCVVGRGCLLWPVHSVGKTLLAFALLHFVLQGQIFCLSRYLLTSYFCIPVPYNEKDISFVYQISWWSRRTCAQLLLWELQNYNSLLNNHWQEDIGCHQKKIPHIWGQRTSPSKMIGETKSHLESNPIPTKGAWRAQTKPCAQQEMPQRLSQTCLWVLGCLLQRCGSAGRGRGSGCSRPGCGISPFGRGHH